MGFFETIRHIVNSVNTFVWFVLITVVVVGYVMYESGNLTERNKMLLIGIAAFGIIMAMRNQDKRLIGIEKARRIAYAKANEMQRNGEINEGVPIKYCEATLQRVDGEPAHYITAVYVEAKIGFFQVFFIHPYEVAEHLHIEKMKQIREFDIEQIPDYKVVVPPDLMSYIQQKKALEEKYGTGLS